MLMMTTHRPRNVNAARAAALLYGDWGTSKAYVIGLAFALAGYASFWPILGVSILSLFVGLSYVVVCKYYPEGGGVYASVRRRAKAKPQWEWLAILGAFFLVADYLVTAALSALAAFSYFMVKDPVLYSALFIVIIGAINYIGPRHTGTFALIIAIAAFAVFTGLALTSIPFLKQGWENLEPLKGDPLTLWTQFCSVVVALSGVETIANTTSIMKLNPNSTAEKPVVTHTSTPALLSVMFEVTLYTTLFGLAATAISTFQIKDQTISAPGFSNLENNMLSYLALVFGSKLFGPQLGQLFTRIMSLVVGLILLSAVNTAMNGLISLQYLMASDGELPQTFRKVNKYGVPLLPLVVVTLVPALLILTVRKLVLLADLYAIGFVGAIAVNLGSTSTDSSLPLRWRERIFLFVVFLFMAAIEVTLFIQKSHARYFVLAIMAAGLLLRWAVKLRKKVPAPAAAPLLLAFHPQATLCVVKKFGRAIRKAVEESNQKNTFLNVVILREQRVLADRDLERRGEKDPIARKIIQYIKERGNPQLIKWEYHVTDSFADITAAFAMLYESPRVIVDAPPSKMLTLVRGNYVETLRHLLPESVTLISIH